MEMKNKCLCGRRNGCNLKCFAVFNFVNVASCLRVTCMYFYIPITKFHTVDEAINILSLTPAVVSPSSKIGFNFSFSAEVSARYSGTGAQ